jgi:hypothetical protein
MWKKIYIAVGLLIAALLIMFFRYKTVEGFALSGETVSTSQFSILSGYITVFLPSALASIMTKLPPTTNKSIKSLREKLLKSVNDDKNKFNLESSSIRNLSKDYLVTEQMLNGVFINGALRKCGYSMRLPLFTISQGPTTYNQTRTPLPGGKVMTTEEYLRLDSYLNFYIKPALLYAKTKISDINGKGIIDTYNEYLTYCLPTSSFKNKDPIKKDIQDGILSSDIMMNLYNEDVLEFIEYIRTKILSPLFYKYQVTINLESLSLEPSANTLTWSTPTTDTPGLSSKYNEEVKRRQELLTLKEAPLSNVSFGVVIPSRESQLTNNIFDTIKSYNAPDNSLSLLDLPKTLDIFGLASTSNVVKSTAEPPKPSTATTTTPAPAPAPAPAPLPTCASLDKSKNAPLETADDCPCVYEYFRPGAMI